MNRRLFLVGSALATATLVIRRPAMAGDPLPAPAHPDPSTWTDDTITAAWIGHSTVLLNIFGTWILTDPVFSTKIGMHVTESLTFGPTRSIAPALPLKELPRLDMVLVSHAHMDHMDVETLRRIDRAVPLVVAANTGDVVADLGFAAVYELDWGQWTEIAGVRIEALKVNHNGWRWPMEIDRSRGAARGRSFNAYLLSKGGKHVVFGGDLAYSADFEALGPRLGGVELAIMPIGGYVPWEQNHSTPEQTVAMCDQMRARVILPVHWATFVADYEVADEPILRLKAALKDAPGRIALDAVGKTWSMGPAARASEPSR